MSNKEITTLGEEAKGTWLEKAAQRFTPSYASIGSIGSVFSLLSLYSAASLLSLGSVGSILSIGNFSLLPSNDRE